MENRFEGKVAAVTGAASGIGRATARRLIEEGAHVIAIDKIRGASWSSDAAQMVSEVVADISDRSIGEILRSAVMRHGGVLDVLINAAGVLIVQPFLGVTRDEWDRTVAVNLSGTFFLSQAAAQLMITAHVHGRIVNVSSVHAVVSEPNAAPYTATKGGIEAMTRTIATELAPYGITANCVRPGATRTGMSAPIYDDDIVAALEARIPLARIAKADEIASAICYLASDESGYTTGTALDVDGGYSIDGSLPGAIYRSNK